MTNNIKKHQKKQFLSIALVLCIISSFFPPTAFATNTGSINTASGNTIFYEIDSNDSSVTITGCNDTATEITIPSEIVSKPVIKIEAGAFSNHENLQTINLKSCTNLTTIGRFAFSNTALENLTLPANLTSIEESAFQCCKLSNVDLSQCSALKVIGKNAFDQNEKLNNVTLPPSITSIYEGAFSSCSLEKIDLSQCTSLWDIDDFAFFGNKSLTKIILPTSINEIRDGAFCACEKLSEINLSECTSLKNIGKQAFSQTQLTSIDLPSSLENLGEIAFQNCDSLEAVNLSKCNKLTKIQNGTFQYNRNLKSVKFPSSITSIDDSAYSLSSITEIDLSNCSGLEIIGKSAFLDNSKLSKVILPKSLTTISDQSFQYCSSLSMINLENCTSLKEIGEEAFSQSKIQSIKFPDSLHKIGENAFSDNSDLTQVKWPHNINFTELNGFNCCTNLPVEVFNEGVHLKSITSIGNGAFNGCSFESIEIPANITHISESALSNMESLKNLLLHEGLKEIGEWAFSNTYIEGILTIPETVTQIGANAFNSTNISGLKIPSRLKRIESSTFENCFNLAGKTVIIPESVEFLGRRAFSLTNNDNENITVEIRNRDLQLEKNDTGENIIEINGQYYHSPFGNGANIRAYETNSQEEPSIIKLLYDALVNDPNKNPNYTYNFTPLKEGAKYKVTGEIPQDATLKLYVNNSELPISLTGQNFSESIPEYSKVTITLSMPGYYDNHFMNSSLTSDWNLGKIQFEGKEKIPINRTMRVDFGKIPITSFQNFTFTLASKNKIFTEGNDYTIQFPYIILEESIKDDNLTLYTNTNNIAYTSSAATANRKDGVFNVTLIPWGNMKITVDSEFSGDNNILIFNNENKLVGQKCVSKSGMYITDSMKAGKYTIVAFNANDMFSAVSSVDALSNMGLKEKKDYTKTIVEISDNKLSEINITTPVLKTNVSSILNKENCSVISDKNTNITGTDHRIRIYYSFKNSAGDISVSIPPDAIIKNIYSETEIIHEGNGYSTKNGTITIKNSKTNGLFYIVLSLKDSGKHTISAFTTVNRISAPIGNTTFEVNEIFLQSLQPILTKKNNNYVTITSTPETDVELILNDKVIAYGITNKCGTTRLTYDLPEESMNGQNFELKAQKAPHNGSYSTTTVTLATKKIGLEMWTAYQTENGRKIVLYDAVEEKNIDSSYYIGSNGYWSISATFTGTSAPTDVITYIGMLDRSVRDVPMTLVKSEELKNLGETIQQFTFAGEILISNESNTSSESTIPQSFAIDWKENDNSFTYNTETVNQIQKSVEKIQNERARQISEAKKKANSTLNNILGEVKNPSEYIFGAKYRISDSTKLASLNPEIQTKVYKLEKAIDSLFNKISASLKLKKDLTEYKSWSEVFKELGITTKKDNRTAKELRNDGFTVCENNGKFTAYKDNTDSPANSISTQNSTARLAKSGPTPLFRSGGIGGVTDGFTFVDGDGNQVDFTADANGNTMQSIQSNAFSEFNSAYNDLADCIKNHPNATQFEFDALNSVGFGLDVYGYLSSFDSINQDAEAMVDWTKRAADMQGYIDELKMFENRYKDSPLCSNAIMRERFIAERIHLLLDNEAYRSGANSIASSILTISGIFDKTGISDGVGAIWDIASNTVGTKRANELQQLFEDLDRQTRIRTQKCEKTDMEDIMKKTRKNHRIRPLIDPSGIVYEAVESNALSEVIATVWYADDSTGTNAKIWDAENYNQKNPQITDKSGAYAWDVPNGWWQVRFEKDGYQPSQTEWLPVPPPQVGLKTAMISTAAPEVISVNAYQDYIEVSFSQYMDTSKQIILPSGMTGNWQSIDNGYSKILHITKEDGFELGSTVSFTIDGIQNYAGTALPSYSSENLTVLARPAQIILNYENIICAKAGTNSTITVRIKDSCGNYMENVTVTAKIKCPDLASLETESVITDENGKAVFNSENHLPGHTTITFTVKGTSLTKTVDLHLTTEDQRPDRPVAQIGSTKFGSEAPKENYVTVQSGEKLILSAENGVTIYYTTDDTCPCQNSESRKVYTEPIIITENTKFRIAAYKNGLDYSERLNITVTVDDSHQHSFNDEWKTDSKNHWHECNCGAHSDELSHELEIKNSKNATSSSTGYTGDKVCKVCGYTEKGNVIPILNDEQVTTKSSESNINNSNHNNVKTGDNSNLMIWLALLFINGGILAGAVLLTKSKNKKHKNKKCKI